MPKMRDCLFAAARRQAVKLSDNAKVKDLVSKLSQQAEVLEKLSLSRYDRTDPELTILLNGRNILTPEKLETPLKDGDLVLFMPPVYGE
jgi:molybdopterin converting factor small subunit